MYCFVYGTLKAGYGNHRILEGKPLVGIGVTDLRYHMINSGFPVIMASDDGLPVKGEVYDITGDLETLQRLDGLEGEGVMYDRKEVPVTLENGDRLVCCLYEGTQRYWARRAAQPDDAQYLVYLDPENSRAALEWSR